MKSNERPESDLDKLRKGTELKINNKIQKLTFPELEHELSVYEIELKMQNISLFDTLEKLTAANKEYEELFELSPVGYFILNEDGVIQKVNERGSEQLGLEKSLLLNCHFSTFLISDSDQDDFYRHMNLISEDVPQPPLRCNIKKFDGGFFRGVIRTQLTRDEQLKFKNLLLMVSDT